jgi:hypothetical protein
LTQTNLRGIAALYARNVEVCGMEQNVVRLSAYAFKTMIPEYDIFRFDNTGATLWIEPAMTLNDAKARIQQLRATTPGDYLIFNQTTAEKIALSAGP